MSELHPSDVVLLALAAGTLDEVQRVAIDDHVRGCARCRAFVRAMEHVGAIVLGRLPLRLWLMNYCCRRSLINTMPSYFRTGCHFEAKVRFD